MDMVLGADEFPSSGHSVGNATMWLVNHLIFRKGQGRPTPAAIWNGPEAWAIEIIECLMRDLWKMRTTFSIRVEFEDGLWLDLNITVRLIASDNKV